MGIGRVELNDIDLSRLQVVKDKRLERDGLDHSRWIFRTRRGAAQPLVFKLWNPGYLRRDTLPAALDAGFYGPGLTPGLRNVIFHKGVCRGYVMSLGARLRDPDPAFVRRLWLTTFDQRWFVNQYRPSHLRSVPEGVTLIDLEGVWPLDAPQEGVGFDGFDDPDYEAFVGAVRSGRMTRDHAVVSAAAHLSNAAARRNAAAPFTVPWFLRKCDGLSKRLPQIVRNLIGVSRDGLIR